MTMYQPVCVSVASRLYTRRAPIAHSTDPGQPFLYLGTVRCDAGDLALSGGGRCAASDYGVTGSFAEDGAYRHNCVLTNGIGADAFVYVVCLKQ
jgi:hypothetical protein